jgi:hypothetical protein
MIKGLGLELSCLNHYEALFHFVKRLRSSVDFYLDTPMIHLSSETYYDDL